MPNKKSIARSIAEASLKIFKIAQPPKLLVLSACGAITCASVFQIFGLSLLIPMLNGMVDPNHYEALMKSYPILRESFEFFSIPTTNKSIFVVVISLILVCIYLENICLFFGQSRSAGIATEVAHTLRIKCFNRLTSFSKSFFDKRNVGELNVTLTTFITEVSQHIHHVSMLFIMLTFCLGFFSLMLIISWRLTIAAFILLPLTHAISSRLSGTLKNSSQSEVNRMVDFSGRSAEVIKNMALTQLSNQENAEEARLSAISREIQKNGYAARKRRFAIPRVVDAVNSTGIVVLACVAAFLFFKMEASSIGRLSAFFIALRRLTSHLEHVLNYWTQAITNVPTLEKVLELFENENKSFATSGTKIFNSLEEDIRFIDLSFRYPNSKKGLDKINLHIPRGNMLAIVGTTGSGKSTLIRLLARFYEHQEGKLLIDGAPISEYDLASFRSKLAVVTQDAMIFSDSLRANVCYGLDDVSEDVLRDALKKACLGELVNSLPQGLDTRIGKNGIELSGGEAQRLSIARAILRNPEIIILDEATSALDSETELAVQTALDSLLGEKTVIVIAHRLSTIHGANNVIVLQDGMIIEQGPASELLEQNGTFRRFHDIQYASSS